MICIFCTNIDISTFTVVYWYNFLSTTYLKYILKLESPKLIYSTSLNSFNSSSSLMNVNHVVGDLVNNKSSSSNKFDKKYKNSSYNQDTLEMKKSKWTKKSRRDSNDYILEDDIFTNSQGNFFDKNSVHTSLLKAQKLGKNRKKDKNKISGADVSVNYNQRQSASELTNADKNVLIDMPLTIQELSTRLTIPAAEIITYLFLKKNISATINQVIDVAMAEEIASNYSFKVLKAEINKMPDAEYVNQSSSSLKIKRSPIITILGHVDHGKTTLLDSILETNLVRKEYGGITQSISAHEIEWQHNSQLYKLVFLDTPGHEAFESMRVRGIQVTDIALLVVAADDGLQPQTIEAIQYVKKMNLPYVVAINKIDKKDVNISRVRENLAIYGIMDNRLSSDTNIIEVSALTGYNTDILLSRICQLSDIKSFMANLNQLGSGIILESYLDQQQGPIASIVIQAGTLKLGDIIVAVNTYGKVKSITNAHGSKVNVATPSSIVRILGFGLVPQAGNLFKVVNSEKEAKNYCINYSNNDNLSQALKSLNARITSDNNANIKQLKLIVKTDTQGSLEAILNLLSKVSQAKVQINIISANFGIISNKDVELALATNSSVVSFNLNNSSKINNLIKKKNIDFKNFNVIYDLFNYIKNCMLDLIDPEYDKKFIGRAIVQTVFDVNKGSVAGCLIKEGKLKRMSYIHVFRKTNLVYQGILSSLKRIKDSVEEVFAHNECGLMCSYDFWQEDDIIDAYELVPREKRL